MARIILIWFLVASTVFGERQVSAALIPTGGSAHLLAYWTPCCGSPDNVVGAITGAGPFSYTARSIFDPGTGPTGEESSATFSGNLAVDLLQLNGQVNAGSGGGFPLAGPGNGDLQLGFELTKPAKIEMSLLGGGGFGPGVGTLSLQNANGALLFKCFDFWGCSSSAAYPGQLLDPAGRIDLPQGTYQLFFHIQSDHFAGVELGGNWTASVAVVVPAPSSLGLLGSAVAGLGVQRRRYRSKSL